MGPAWLAPSLRFQRRGAAGAGRQRAALLGSGLALEFRGFRDARFSWGSAPIGAQGKADAVRARVYTCPLSRRLTEAGPGRSSEHQLAEAPTPHLAGSCVGRGRRVFLVCLLACKETKRRLLAGAAPMPAARLQPSAAAPQRAAGRDARWQEQKGGALAPEAPPRAPSRPRPRRRE